MGEDHGGPGHPFEGRGFGRNPERETGPGVEAPPSPTSSEETGPPTLWSPWRRRRRPLGRTRTVSGQSRRRLRPNLRRAGTVLLVLRTPTSRKGQMTTTVTTRLSRWEDTNSLGPVEGGREVRLSVGSGPGTLFQRRRRPSPLVQW